MPTCTCGLLQAALAQERGGNAANAGNCTANPRVRHSGAGHHGGSAAHQLVGLERALQLDKGGSVDGDLGQLQRGHVVEEAGGERIDVLVMRDQPRLPVAQHSVVRIAPSCMPILLLHASTCASLPHYAIYRPSQACMTHSAPTQHFSQLRTNREAYAAAGSCTN